MKAQTMKSPMNIHNVDFYKDKIRERKTILIIRTDISSQVCEDTNPGYSVSI